MQIPLHVVQIAIPIIVFALLSLWLGPARFDGETRCLRCGCILRGIPEPRCSECGERI